TDCPECRLQAAGAADRQDDLSRLQVFDLGTGHGRCGQAFDLEQGQVGRRVAPDQRCLGALVVNHDLDLILLLDDVVGGQHEAAIPNDAGAGAPTTSVDPDYALARFLD